MKIKPFEMVISANFGKLNLKMLLFSSNKRIKLEPKLVTAAKHYGSMRSRRRHDFILAGAENGRFLLGTYTCRWD